MVRGRSVLLVMERSNVALGAQPIVTVSRKSAAKVGGNRIGAVYHGRGRRRTRRGGGSRNRKRRPRGAAGSADRDGGVVWRLFMFHVFMFHLSCAVELQP